MDIDCSLRATESRAMASNSSPIRYISLKMLVGGDEGGPPHIMREIVSVEIDTRMAPPAPGAAGPAADQGRGRKAKA
jgi:hypothetical protein